MRFFPAPTRLRIAAGFLPVLCLVLSSAAALADWPEFRGPTRQGHATGTLPLHWSATSNVVWKAPVPGQGWSSPVTRGNRIYLTTALSAEGLSLRALCLDAADGRVVWDREVFATAAPARIHGKNGHASPTPILEGDRLYVHFGHEGTAALDLEGRVLWRSNENPYVPVHGSGGSPALVGDRLIFSADGDKDPAVIALDKATGKTLWKVPRQSGARSKFSFSTPLAVEVDGRTQVITPGSGVVSALDPKDGSEIWRVGYGDGYSIVPRPVTGHGLVFITTGYDRPTAIAIRLGGGGGDVTASHVAWRLTRGVPNTPSLLLVGDLLYMVNDGGIASCVDARSGEVFWSERVGGNYSSSPLHADGRVYFQNEEGVTSVVATGREFRVLARNELGERALASPAVFEGSLLLRTAGHLFRIQEGGAKTN